MRINLHIARLEEHSIDIRDVIRVLQSSNFDLTLGDVTEAWREVPSSVDQFAQGINGEHPTYDYRTLSRTGAGSNVCSVTVPEGFTGDVASEATAA